MILAVISDTHCGVRNSSDIFIEYQERFYKEVFFPYLESNNIKTIIHLGDYYDNRKNINFKALNANRKHFLEPMRDLDIHMDIIPGNHDTFWKNNNNLCSLKELLGYFTSNINIIMKPEVMSYDGFKLGLVPWINPENYNESINFLNQCDASWIGAHLELSGFEMMKGIPNNEGMDMSMFSRFESVITGHFHTKSSKDNIHYLGAQMEFTWADANDQKYFHIINTETRELVAIRNPITIFEKLIYNDTNMDYNKDYDLSKLNKKFVKVIVSKKNDPYMFDRFISKMQDEARIYDLKIVESFDGFLGKNVELELDSDVKIEDTLNLLDSYIENVEGLDLNKSKLKDLMRSVYLEALNMGVK